MVTAENTSLLSPRYRLAWGFLLLAIVVRLGVAYSEKGYYHPDEFTQYIEPAYQQVFPNQQYPSDTSEGLSYRSYIIQGWHQGILAAIKATGLYSPSNALATLRIAQSLLGLFILYFMFLLVRSRIGLLWALWLLGAWGLWYQAVFFTPRLLSENYALLFIMPGLWYLERWRLSSARNIAFVFGAGALFGVATWLRLQAGFICIGPGLWLLWRREWRALGAFCAGFAALFLTQGVADLVFRGQLFASLLSYYDATVTRGLSMMANGPWWDFFRGYNIQFGEWLFPFVVGLVIIGGGAVSSLLGMTLVGFVVATSLFPHKEMRFVNPILPLIFILATYGLHYLCVRLQKRQRLIAIGSVVLLMGVTTIVRGWPRLVNRDADHDAFVLMEQVGTLPDLGHLIVIERGTGLGHFTLHKDVPMSLVWHVDHLKQKSINDMVDKPSRANGAIYILFPPQRAALVSGWLGPSVRMTTALETPTMRLSRLDLPR